MAAEIKNLDTDLQMLVYENYNKFISATDTIKRMKNNIVGMEANMEQLIEKIMSVQSRSDGVNTSLFKKREHIEKLHRTQNLLRKVQFIYDLPVRLGKCIKAEAYADAVRFFTGAKPIFEAYGDSSFQDCKKASEEAMDLVIQNLQAKLYSDSEPIEARAEAVVLLKQLNFPVDNLKAKLLEKLEDYLVKFKNEPKVVDSENNEPSAVEKSPGPAPVKSPRANVDSVSIGVFSKTVRAYLIIFPDSEGRLIKLAIDLFTKRYESVQQQITKRLSSGDLLRMLRAIWDDITVMDEVLPEAALPVYSLEATSGIIKWFISAAFSHLLLEASESLIKIRSGKKEGLQASPLQFALESSKKAVIQGSMDLLLEFRQLLNDDLELLAKLRDLMIDWAQEGFQSFFQNLDKQFLLLSGKSNSSSQDVSGMDSMHVDKVDAGLILVLAQVSVFIEQSAIPRITEEIASSFSGGGSRGYENGPAFVPGEICRLFRSAGEKFLHLYINLKTQKISILLKKRFTTPNWIKHKEPREVHMFVDLLFQELEGIRNEVSQILPRGVVRRHRHSDSTGSTNSSRSNPLREDKLSRSNTQRARSQLLESHLAKLFEQKMEIFTKIEYTQESVISTAVKLCLKSLQEFVRLQTFNRSGYQQIQLDIEFLKKPLKEFVDDDAAVDFLLQEVTNAAHERCLDPIPLEVPILDKLINAKLAKTREQHPSSQ
ncbi:vacuolar protein sorting-associated protein 51 homolog isoform X1 [Asparagus officinalis]|uniref:vacuolar protein sorting-associated protein 51 homolog isoform X1 n=1 Tax=Asparagus officinalis TaxID=4686 RepID=UPI00098E5070|nr:vacuolar protein sorting-associated protein 51 homolog isoform X1 [Asparagus officinalis]XP_020254942.1 vacuolar protein sorting-associated protein 51 homolog isoform X1 [Asparagus officinalis]